MNANESGKIQRAASRLRGSGIRLISPHQALPTLCQEVQGLTGALQQEQRYSWKSFSRHIKQEPQVTGVFMKIKSLLFLHAMHRMAAGLLVLL